MANDSPGNDPRTIWQTQPTQPSAMTLETIRQNVQELHSRTRRELLRNVGVPLVIIALCSFGIKQFPQPGLRSLFAFAIVWSLAGLYFLHRGMWSAMLPGDAALSTGLESYRREVERRRSLSGRIMLWGFGPLVFAVATLIAVILSLGTGSGVPLPEGLRKMTPFLTLLSIWFIGVFAIRMRQRRELQREIDELNDIESENRR
jgi:hypothetical protein